MAASEPYDPKKDKRVHKRRKRRREKAFGILFWIDVWGLILTMAYSGLVIPATGKVPWLGFAAFVAFGVGLLIPSFRELAGFADRYSGVEEEFYRRHVDPPARKGEMDVFSPGHLNVWRQSLLPRITAGLAFTALGLILWAADAVVIFLL